MNVSSATLVPKAHEGQGRICSAELYFDCPFCFFSVECSPSLPTVNSPGIFPQAFGVPFHSSPSLGWASLLCDPTAPFYSFAALRLPHYIVIVYLLVSLSQETLNSKKTGPMSCLWLIPPSLGTLPHTHQAVNKYLFHERMSE